MNTKSPTTIPERKDVLESDAWNLAKLYDDDSGWEADLAAFKNAGATVGSIKGTLGESAEKLREALDLLMSLEKTGERLGYYAMLRQSEDAGSSKNQERWGRYVAAATELEALTSFVKPEIQAIPDDTMESFLKADILSEYKVYLRKLIRYKPHILSEKEERLLAMQEESNQTARSAFSALTDVDMEFGTIETPEGEKPLSQSSFSSFMLSPNREIRKKAYTQFMKGFDGHKNTLSSLYIGSVHLDVYRAKVRNFPSARAAALFSDNIPETVYDSLVDAVSHHLEPLHAYYALRKRVQKIDDFSLFDTKVPLVPNIHVHHTYEQAVDRVIEALAPLGDEYTETLRSGLLGGWVDKYENKGKRSGAFSAGSYVGDPYILMNYKDDVIRDVFTLAHEGGHSMHSWYSARSNPFQHYDYTIFEAEVASTFNENLLLRHMLDHVEDDAMRAYLINKQIDDIIGTLYRQTMFAEFEHMAHAHVESGNSLSLDWLRATYKSLIEKYFGDGVQIDEHADLEGLRIPHFYRAFYVFKYATGISAALTLAERVMTGGDSERKAYFAFLKSGGSRYPIESLKSAGVDMTQPDAVETALSVFASRVEELTKYLA